MFDKELIRLDTCSFIGYKLYQTGIDNYRYEFYGVSQLDTTKIFETYLNDATYKVAKFNTIVTNDTILINCSLNLGVMKRKFQDFNVKLKHDTNANKDNVY